MWHGYFLKKIVVETLNDVCFLFWISYIIDNIYIYIYIYIHIYIHTHTHIYIHIYHELFELFHYTIIRWKLTQIFPSKSSDNLYFSWKIAFFWQMSFQNNAKSPLISSKILSFFENIYVATLHRDCGDTMALVCHVILQDHVFKTCYFMARSPAR